MRDGLNLDVYFPKFGQFLLSAKELSAFEKLCAVGAWEVDAAHALEATLCKHFGLEKQVDWPLAPLALMGARAKVEAGYWFLVHPVHFVLQRDFFTLSNAVKLTGDEKEVLVAHLNRHFPQDALHFMVSHSDDFLYMHVHDDVEVKTYLLSEAMGRDVGKFMPQGPHEMRFKSLLNEVQMLLHDHPINQAREQQGLLTVNSLWLSGGGNFKEMSKPRKQIVFQFFGNDPLSAGLASWTGVSCGSLGSDFSSLETKGHAVVVVNACEDLETAWFGPLFLGLKSGKLKTLRCHFDVHGMTFTLNLKSLDAWKFWRRLAPIASYFNLSNA